MKSGGKSRLRAGMGRFLEAIIGALVVLVALVASALGQAPVAQPPYAAPTSAPSQRTTHAARKPFRAARLTYLDGNVDIEQSSTRTQDPAVLNMPLVEGVALTTGDDGQAEIEFEDGSIVRITPNSGVSLLKLSVDAEGNYQTRVAVLGGLVYAELRAGTRYQYSLQAGGDIVTPAENSTVRLNIDELPVLVSVLQGSVHVASANGSSGIDAQAGETARSDAEQQGAPFVVKSEIAPETWDQWNEDRDQIAAGEAGTQTAARDQFAGDQGYGWSDLDANGSWYSLPGQGEIWQPNEAGGDDANTSEQGVAGQDNNQSVGAGFDPYGYGSWVWTPAGYSWASGYGWGWLPYRCGEWLYLSGFGWGWQPGVGCGAFGFGGYSFGGFGFGVNVGRAPGSWKHPKRPIPGPGPVHPIVHGPVGLAPILVTRDFGEGRVIRVKTIAGRSIEPLPPLASISSLRGVAATGSALRRDYPVAAGTREPELGIPATHIAPSPIHSTYSTPATGSTGRQPGNESGLFPQTGPGAPIGTGRRPSATGRSNMVPALPSYGNQPSRPSPASAPRPQPVPQPRPSAPPVAAPSRAAPSAPASSASQHK